MIEKVANKFFKGNQGIALMAVAGVGLVLFILIIIIISNLFSGKKEKTTYSDLENKLVSAAEKYYKANENLLPKEEGETTSVNDKILSENKYMDDIDKIYSKDKCSAVVEVIKTNDSYIYQPIVTCENYSTVKLVDEMKKNVVSSGDGLYYENGNYRFKGEYVNNYVEFDKKMWKVVSIDENGIKMVLINEKLEKNTWDDRYNLEKKANYGKNIFDSSRIKEYLESSYKNNTFVSEKRKKYLVNATWCIGGTLFNTEISEVNVCNETTKGYIGLLQVDDYAKSSLETTCKKINDPQCVNYNHLAKLSESNWTLNKSSGNSYDVFYITSSGIDVSRASKQNSIRPTIYLNSNVVLDSGNGSSEKPYKIRYQ